MKEMTYKRNLISLILVNSVLAFIFVRSQYWNFNDGILREMALLIALAILLLFVPLIVICSSKAANRLNTVCEHIINAVQDLIQNYKKVLYAVGLLFAAVALSIGLSYAISAVFSIANNMILLSMILSICLIAVMIWLLRSHIQEKPEQLFLAAVLIAGSFMIAVRPCEVGYSWDDHIHFVRTMSLATLDGPYYLSDYMIYENAWEPASKASQEERAERTQLLNESYANGELYEVPRHGNLRYLCIESYAPYAAGIIFGRGIGLSYVNQLRSGMFFNLLFYTFVFYWAMTKLKTGKVLVAVIGLMPTNLFMVTSFSYDPWITAWLVLGFAYYFGYLQDQERKLSNADMCIMIFAFWIGCLPKAIYFLLMFPLLFLPKRVFNSNKQRSLYYFLVVISAGYLASTFVLPKLLHGFGQGDTTGTAAVNSGSQVEYILSEPLVYAKILLNFLISFYVNPLRIGEYSVNYAYMGVGKAFYYLVPLIMWITAWTDKDGESTKTKPAFASTAFSMFWLIILIPTAMYISFTAYRNPTIEGAQPRYLIPLVFPALYLHSFDCFRNPISRKIYNMIPIVLMALIVIVDFGCMLYVRY